MRQIGRISIFTALAVVLSLILVACGGGGEEEAEVQTTEGGSKVVEAAGMTFEWSIDGETIEMTVTSPEQGWVAVGFDPETVMKGADMIMGYVEDGEATVADHYGDQLTNHSADTELGGTDDVTVIEGSEDESGTTLSFSIPLDSGDEYDNPLAEGQTHSVMLAYGTEDNFTEQHPSDGRATVEVEL